MLAAAADRAVAKLAEQSKSENPQDWAWKKFNSLDMLHPIGQSGILKSLFSITDKPQSGTGYSVRAATKRHGPSERFVANPANWDDSILLITSGESGQLGSSHYSDQFSFWYEGKADCAALQRWRGKSGAQAHADSEAMRLLAPDKAVLRFLALALEC